MEKDVDVQALSAAIAGFLACHILTCRFLVQEGVVDQDRFSSYLETAMAEMAPGIEDQRTLFGLRQLITALRAPVTPKPVQLRSHRNFTRHARRRRTRDRAPDSVARAPAGARAALGAARGAVPDQEARADHGAAAAALQTALEKIEICRVCGNIDTPESVHGLHRPAARSRHHRGGRRRRRPLGARARACGQCALPRARRHPLAARWHRPGRPSIDALVTRAHEPEVTEVILALNATVDGQTTAHYITDLLHDANVKVTRLAHGVPVGGELDYLDEGTLSAAIRQRTTVLVVPRCDVHSDHDAGQLRPNS